MRKIRLPLLIVYIFFFIFCSLKNDDDLAVNEASIVGTWYWKESNGGILGNENVTPKSTGVTIKLVFGTNKKVTVFTNDIETGTYTYTIDIGKSIFDNEPKYLLNFDQMSYVIRKIDKEEMSIQDNFVDGYVLTYIK